MGSPSATILFIALASSCCNAQFLQYYFANPAIQTYFLPNYYNVPQQFTVDYKQTKEEPQSINNIIDDTVEVGSSNQDEEQNFSPASENYRGFGYHTNYNDGASATVVFFRGNEHLQNNINNNNERFTVRSSNPFQSLLVEERFSDILNGNVERKVPFQNLARIVERLQEDKAPEGVVHFYSSDDGFPVVSSRSNVNATSNKNVTQRVAKNKKLEDGADESVQSRTISKVNSLIELVDKNISISSTTVASSSTTSTAKSDVAISLKSEETTTENDSEVETTTSS